MPEAHADDDSAVRLCVFDRIIAGYDRELQQLRLQIEHRKRQQASDVRPATAADIQIRRAA